MLDTSMYANVRKRNPLETIGQLMNTANAGMMLYDIIGAMRDKNRIRKNNEVLSAARSKALSGWSGQDMDDYYSRINTADASLLQQQPELARSLHDTFVSNRKGALEFKQAESQLQQQNNQLRASEYQLSDSEITKKTNELKYRMTQNGLVELYLQDVDPTNPQSFTNAVTRFKAVTGQDFGFTYDQYRENPGQFIDIARKEREKYQAQIAAQEKALDLQKKTNEMRGSELDNQRKGQEIREGEFNLQRKPLEFKGAELDNQRKEAELKKLQNEQATGGAPVKPLSETAASALSNAGGAVNDFIELYGMLENGDVSMLSNVLTNPKFAQLQLNLSNYLGRKDSGAAINADEWKKFSRMVLDKRYLTSEKGRAVALDNIQSFIKRLSNHGRSISGRDDWFTQYNQYGASFVDDLNIGNSLVRDQKTIARRDSLLPVSTVSPEQVGTVKQSYQWLNY